MAIIDEQQFRKKAEAAIQQLKAGLIRAEESSDIEVEEQNGVLAVSFEEPPAKFVITPNSAARQIWISALGTSFKLDLDENGTFVFHKSGEDFSTLVARLVNEQLGENTINL